MITDIISQLKRDEGTSLKLYRDSRGFWTIGTGRNLDADGISEDENDLMLANDIKLASVRLNAAFPFAASLDEVRRGVLLNMTFNMGIGGLLEFKQFLASVQSADWNMAALNMLNSRWATQVGPRAKRLARQIWLDEWQ